MAGRQTADIVFCMDASGSMSHAFNGVRENVFKLIDTFKSDLQFKWDVRFDFLAYCNDEKIMRLKTLNLSGTEVIDALYKSRNPNGVFSSSSKFFTSDISKFKSKLSEIVCEGDEGTCLALDIAADFPFRDATTCHRTVILLTDEPIEAGTNVSASKSRIMDLAKKYQEKKISLFMVTPECDVFDTLSQIDKCEWTIDESRGLTNVDFSKFLEGIGKSVSVSQNAISAINEAMPLFNENNWNRASGGYFGDDGFVGVNLSSGLFNQ